MSFHFIIFALAISHISYYSHSNAQQTSCEDVWQNGNKQALIDTSNLYQLQLPGNTTTIQQRCIFISFPSIDKAFVGVMFESFDLENGYNGGSHKCVLSDTTDACKVSQNNVNYNNFRWSYLRLLNYWNSITNPYLFISCNGQTDIGNSYDDGNDHILLKFFTQFTNSTFNAQCFETESINIRNKGCANTITRIWQPPTEQWHVDSNLQFYDYCTGANPACNYTDGSVHSENNFGLYTNRSINNQFQCTQNSASTTNLFIGSIFDYTPSPTGLVFNEPTLLI